MPGRVERQRLHPAALGLLRQWDRLIISKGLLYRRPDGVECVYQLVLLKSLREEVFQQLHTHHGHQGSERTTELIQQMCYWLGMGNMIKDWCQSCDRCSVAKRQTGRRRDVPSRTKCLPPGPRNKIQAARASEIFQVVKPPEPGSVVYAVAPRHRQTDMSCSPFTTQTCT